MDIHPPPRHQRHSSSRRYRYCPRRGPRAATDVGRTVGRARIWGAGLAEASAPIGSTRPGSPGTGRPWLAVSLLSRWIPTASDSCWHATALMSASKTVGNRGGLTPRSSRASRSTTGSHAASTAKPERSMLRPRSRSSASRAIAWACWSAHPSETLTARCGMSTEPLWVTESAIVLLPTRSARR